MMAFSTLDTTFCRLAIKRLVMSKTVEAKSFGRDELQSLFYGFLLVFNRSVSHVMLDFAQQAFYVYYLLILSWLSETLLSDYETEKTAFTKTSQMFSFFFLNSFYKVSLVFLVFF